MQCKRALVWVVLILYSTDVGLCTLANILDNLLFLAITKIVLMPLLFVYLVLHTTPSWLLQHVVFAVAMGFAWAGDIALLIDTDTAFYTGLGLFLMTHILYSISFIRHAKVHRVLVYVIAGVVYSSAGAIVVHFIAKVETPLVVTLVAFYTAAVASMAITASNLNIFGAFGGLLFAISDSLIALRKFGTWSWIPEDHIVSALVIAFYGMAQLLLAVALIRNSRRKRVQSLDNDCSYDIPMIVRELET